MKNKFAIGVSTLLVALLAVLLMEMPLVSQQSSPLSVVQQTATMLNAATVLTTSSPAANSQATCTMTPTGNNYVYITSISLDVANNGTATTQNNVAFTTTGITGTPAWQYSILNTANLSVPTRVMNFNPPIKGSTPGVAVVITGPSGNTNTLQTCAVSWFQAQ